MSCKVGNQTNSQDPVAVNSRVFVGNLNTFQCSKTDVERMFQRYGRIAGISMHKGYAFIQFTNPFDARSACLGEDGRLLWGQTLDVNMVAEPKAHQTGRKRQNVTKTGNDWDYYYDSYYAQVGLPTPRLVPPIKRPRIHVPTNQNNRANVSKVNSPSNKLYHNNNNNNNNGGSASLADLKSYSTPDILICGNCRELFSEIEQLIEHKKTYCKLRFTCKCHMLRGKMSGEEPATLLCSQCKDSFHSAWDLMVHVQSAHMLNIYQLNADVKEAGVAVKDSMDVRDLGFMDGRNAGHGLCNHSNGNGSGSSLASSTEDISTSTCHTAVCNGIMNRANGMLNNIVDSVMEDSHCQTDPSPNLDETMSSSVGFVNNGTNSGIRMPHLECTRDTQTDDAFTRSAVNVMANNNKNDHHLNHVNNNGMSDGLDSSYQTQPQKNDVLSLRNSSTALPSSVNNNNNNNVMAMGSSSFNSIPIEASTQTLQVDDPMTVLDGEESCAVASDKNGSPITNCGSKFDETCGLVTSLKSEPSHLNFAEGQMAGL